MALSARGARPGLCALSSSNRAPLCCSLAAADADAAGAASAAGDAFACWSACPQSTQSASPGASCKVPATPGGMWCSEPPSAHSNPTLVCLLATKSSLHKISWGYDSADSPMSTPSSAPPCACKMMWSMHLLPRAPGCCTMLSKARTYAPCGGVHRGRLGGRPSEAGRHAEATCPWAACSKVGEAWRPTHNTAYMIMAGLCLRAASLKITIHTGQCAGSIRNQEPNPYRGAGVLLNFRLHAHLSLSRNRVNAVGAVSMVNSHAAWRSTLALVHSLLHCLYEHLN